MTQKRFIYADNAATTKMSERAVEVMKKYLTDNYGNASQPYSFARSSKKVLNEAREIIASVIGAKPNEIFFTSGGTESDNWVLLNAWQHGLKIVTSQIEHHAVLNTCAFIGKHGGKVVYLPVTDSGIVSLSDVKNHVDENCLLSVMMVNNEIGSIQPMEEIAAIVKECGGLVHSDAVQAVGHIPINVDKNRIDMLSASAHKFNGPKGGGISVFEERHNCRPTDSWRFTGIWLEGRYGKCCRHYCNGYCTSREYRENGAKSAPPYKFGKRTS